ncbi:MAG: SDR family NAD(P)-dependent oxidoreductase [Bacilli bacterium]|nr:SDR family NAD(P)-dependent oxidoreductase [Bacilli bacterium]
MKALITGASSGIGRDMAYYLSDKGIDLILVGRNLDELKKVKEKCKSKATVYDLDLSIKENVFKLYDITKDENIDILINNAGFGLFGNFYETDLEKELNMINVNIIAVHILTKLFLKDFIKRDKGYILNVASSAGFMAGPKLSTYYSTKNYVLKSSLAIYEELRHMNSNVKISVLCPGPVETNFNKVAGGSFNTKSATSEYVARYAIDKMFKNKLVIIPTIKIKLAVFLTRLVPTKLLLRINYHIQNVKIKKYNKNKD